MKRNLLAAFAISVVPLQAWAHEGHGIAGQGHTVSHFAFDPLHLPMAILGCAAAIWFAVQLRNRVGRVSQRT